MFFHDESTFSANEDQNLMWGVNKPKSRGAGIMVSDFIDEHNVFLSLTDTDEEYDLQRELIRMHVNMLEISGIW